MPSPNFHYFSRSLSSLETDIAAFRDKNNSAVLVHQHEEGDEEHNHGEIHTSFGHRQIFGDVHSHIKEAGA